MTQLLCDDRCYPVCDFCVFYDDDDSRYGRLCAGWGLCLFDGHMTVLEDGDDCPNFVCKNCIKRPTPADPHTDAIRAINALCSTQGDTNEG